MAELTWRCGQNQTTELLPALDFLLRQVKADLRSARAVIVARGPGGFTSLRVGISVAKGISFSLGIPLVGISTLEVEAYQHAESGLPACPVFDAGRGEIAVAIYQKKRNAWCQLMVEQITTLDALISQITMKTLFCGESLPSITAQLKERLKQKAVISSPAARLRRAVFLAELGMKRLQAGDYDNPATLQPLYLRRPVITERRHL